MSRGLRAVWQSIWGGWIGYSLHSEAMACALHEQGVYLMHRPVDSVFSGPPRKEALRRVVHRAIDDDAPQISYCQADQFHVAHPGHKIGFTMLEVDGLPADWVEACNRMDEIFVPSEFNRQTFLDSGVQRTIRTIPLGIDSELFHLSGPAHRMKDCFTFLSVFEWGERKAPELLLKAFNDEFLESEAVLLLLKVDNRDPSVDVQQVIGSLRLSSGGAPIGFLYNQPIPDPQMAILYRSADCFVLPTRGEGWGMPILEAMACGLPAIATAWGGQTEFMSEENSYPLEVAEMIPARARCPYYEGFRWANPSYEHLRHLMRRVFQNQQEAREKGRRAAQEVAEKWTWERTAERIKERLAELPAT